MERDYPEFVRSLGDTAIESLGKNPTAEDVAEDAAVIVEEYYDVIEENQRKIVEASDRFDYDEITERILNEIMLGMVISTVMLDVVEYVCENIDANITPDEVLTHLPDKYIEVETSGI